MKGPLPLPLLAATFLLLDLGLLGRPLASVSATDTTLCPAPGSSISLPPHYPADAAAAVDVSLRVVSPSDELCALILVTTDAGGSETFAPVGRSYAGYDWEGVHPLHPVDFSCLEANSTCSATLPPTGTGQEYRLVSFRHSASPEEQASRLLIQSTFGPTAADLEDYMTNHGAAGGPASFVRSQMDLPPTHHRAFFRRNTQARVHGAYDVGRPRHPCEAGSRWRKFALTWEDYRAHNDHPISVDNSTGPPYLLRVKGTLHCIVAAVCI